MSTFEYISVFVAIILGMGIAQIVTGIAHFVHSSNKVKLYWPHLFFIFNTFFFHIQEWWVYYEYKSFTEWRMPVFIFVMLYPIDLFVQARVLFPFDNFDEETDLKKFWYSNYRTYFLLIAIATILSLVDNIFLRHMQIQDQVLQMVLCVVMLSMVIFKVRNEWVHKALALLFFVGTIVSMIAAWDEWTIK